MAKKKGPWPIGLKIKAVRMMTPHEVKEMDWYRPGVALVLEDGGVIFGSRDEEGNDAGALMGAPPPPAPIDLIFPDNPPGS